MSENLFDFFRADAVDQSELEELLQIHFGWSGGVSNSEIEYTHAGASNGPAITLFYSDDGRIAKIASGPGLRPDDVAAIAGKIQSQLIDAGDVQIGQVVLFASTPIDGGYRYSDVFQFLPLPPEAPRPPFSMGDHPLLMQYRVQSSPDMHIAMHRRTRIGRELELLAAAFTTGIRGSIGYVSRFHWSLLKMDDPANWRSEYCQEVYTYPGANGIAPEFASIAELHPIKRIEAQAYFTRTGISPGQVLDLPDSVDTLLDRYFALPRAEQDHFLRACFWLQYAQRVAHISHSGAFTALVSAIESLMPDLAPTGHCDACNRPIGAGPTKQFTSFVEQFAPGPGTTSADRRKLYALRSALSHGGRLLHSDRFAWNGAMTATSLSEWHDQRSLWQTVRVALINWLLSQRRP